MLTFTQETEEFKKLIAENIITKEQFFYKTKWDNGKQEIITHGLSMNMTDLVKRLELLTDWLTNPTLVHRFHSTRPLADQYSGKYITFLLELSLRDFRSADAFQLLTEMSETSILDIMKCRMKRATLQRSPSCSRASEDDRAELDDGPAQHRTSTATSSMTSSLDALRTWMQHGRGHIPVPLLHNEGNRCYRNAAISALVICYHHTKALACRWGCVHDIVEAARLEWHGLSAVTSFRSSEENWPEPWLQHDVCEYLVHLTRSIPLLQPVAAEARVMTEAGVVKEDCLCILDLPRSGLTLQECFRHWQISSGVVKGLLVAPPVLCIP